VAHVRYYGAGFAAYWTSKWKTIEDAIAFASQEEEISAVVKGCDTWDKRVATELTKIGGDKYARIGALSYRQTLAATKLVWNNASATMPHMLNFMKEPSSAQMC